MADATLRTISTVGSDRATSGAGSKIITRNDSTHVVWQDATEGGHVNRARTFDHETGEFTDPVSLNAGKDNHARPNMTVDPEGYLHVVLGGHNSQPIDGSQTIHRRSVEPNDTSAWTDPEPIGDGTYPMPASSSDGSLYTPLRSANRWNGVDFYARPPRENWRQTTKLVYRPDKYDGYASYHTGLAVAEDGTVHAVIDFYEGEGVYERRGLHQAVTAIRSPDGGETWTTADGTEIDTPARPSQLDVIARDRAESRIEDKPQPVIRAKGNIALDSQQRPHVIYLDHRPAPGRVMHATIDDDGGWSCSPITAIENVFSEYRPVDCRGALTARADGTLFVLLKLIGLGEGWENGLPTRALLTAELEKDHRLVWLVLPENETTGTVYTAASGHTEVFQPTVERAVGANRIPVDQLPRALFLDSGDA